MMADWYPEGGYVPDQVWYLMGDLAIFAAVVATISGVMFLWRHGPRLLIKYGPTLFTTWGNRWDLRRNGDSNENP